MLRKLCVIGALLCGSIAGAQTPGPPANTAMDDGTRRGSVASYTYCYNGTAWVGCNPGSGGGGGGGGGGTSATATTAAPSYTDGNTAAPLSLNLSGDLRTIAKQSGAWSMGITGTLPSFTTTPTFNLGTAPTLTVTGPLTDTQLRASNVPVSGPLTDTQLRASAIPTTALTDTQLRATAVPISGALTDTQLRASAVPVSGPATDTQLRAAPLPVDTVVRATSTDRGAIIGFSGAAITTTSGSATITLTTVPTSGAIVLGQIVIATGIPAGTTINALASGTLNAVSSTYTLSANATATGSAVVSTSAGPQQIMAANSNRRGVAYQVQSSTSICYINGTGAVTTDYHSLQLAAGAYFDTPPHHVGTGANSVQCTLAATPLYAREF